MFLLVRRFLGIAVILFISSLFLLSSLTLLTLAQTPSPLKITIVPQAQQAVAGQPFTYTVVVSNVSQTPVAQPVIFTETPTGTTFVAIHLPENWLVGNLRVGETGFLAWNSDEPIRPGEVVTFSLAVMILPEMADRSLVNEPVTIMSEADREFFVTGLPVTVPVLAAPPTPIYTPTPAITNTPYPMSTASATQTPQPVATELTPMTPTPASTTETDITPPPTGSTPSAPPSPSTPTTTSSRLVPAGATVVTVLVIIGVVVSLVWLFMRR